MISEQKRAALGRLSLTLSMLSADGVEAANSGHPGMPMGTSDMAAVLWFNHLRFNPTDPRWEGRDRFVLSAGHGSMLLYSLLHLAGFDLPLEELKQFRQWGSRTPGHPEFGMTPGVESTTGPLGQGFANGVGMALSSKLLGARYGQELFGFRVFGIVSDGDLMEGIASEAASHAGQLGLDNLVYLYDDNDISIGGSTDVCFTESVPDRFRAYDWHVQEIDGHDLDAIDSALSSAKGEAKRPSLICAKTTIGRGSPNKAGTAGVHGAPLGKEELELTKQELGWEHSEPFFVPEEVKEFCSARIDELSAEYRQWQERFQEWRKEKPEQAKLYDLQSTRDHKSGLDEKIVAEISSGKSEATRALSGKALQVIASHSPALIGGSADLEPSTKTLIKDSPDINRGAFSGKNIRFGVREHSMAGIANGLAYGQNWIPYVSTFLVFSDYMRPSIRLAALSHLQVLYVFTHDSIFVGEDGPTHQPVEHLWALRSIPGLHVHRPGDAVEVAQCYLAMLERKDGPGAIVLTRQGVEPIEREAGFDPASIKRGGYALKSSPSAQITLVASGSEVAPAVGAAQILEEAGISVQIASIPCVELFTEQSDDYRSSVISPSSRVVTIEAGIEGAWRSVVRSDSLHIGVEGFGSSAPAGTLKEKFGLTPQSISNRVREWLS